MKRRTTTTRVEEILDPSVDPSAGTTIPGDSNHRSFNRDYTSSVAVSETETKAGDKPEDAFLTIGRTPSDLVAGFQTSLRGVMATILTIASFTMCLAFVDIENFIDWLIMPIVLSPLFCGTWFGVGLIEKRWKQE